MYPLIHRRSLEIIETHLVSPISAVEVGEMDRFLKSFNSHALKVTNVNLQLKHAGQLAVTTSNMAV